MANIKKTLTPKEFKSFKLIYDKQGNLKTDLALLDILRDWRRGVMKKTGLPSTCIFYNSCLVRFATYYPQSREEFLKIFGVGNRKWEKYGVIVAKIIFDYLENVALGEDNTIPF